MASSAPDTAALVKTAQQLSEGIISSKGIPSEESTVHRLESIMAAASQLANQIKSAPSGAKDTATANSTSTLLSLDSKSTHSVSLPITVDLLSKLAHRVVSHPPVYLTPAILTSYVSIQSTLQRPTTIPEVFALYATKPAPVPGSDPVKYRSTSPTAASQAIPSEVADLALTAAIEAADLPLALAIIETSYGVRAFQRNKFVKRALPALTGLGLAPAAAIMVGSHLTTYTNAVDPAQLTAITAAGILTYVAATATIGFVAITTRNDQMERVTWVTGLPLRQRWLREEERAAVDRVAQAWGFKEVDRRGEEEGEEWEMLRDWCGLRGMILDRVDLMDGME
ncbi:hypothetical protein EJ06DRAFT_555915 [Trichodelitschia bisporula]|uniref:Uncharacterized protein n=1 Tax=Trichodelitschia bisporula TaxID=703511 RepID=A0A6G1I027_9PEZI|nr:hypothetical protein EJ06DRAFT_555915 [Trichodelitschia bisporula]